MSVNRGSSKHFTSLEGGFSLLELGFVMIIMTIIMMAVYAYLDISIKQLREERAQRVIKNVEMAINQFWAANGRYPCPADPALTEDNALYGFESCGSTLEVDGADPTRSKVLVGVLPTYIVDAAGISQSFMGMSHQDSDIIQLGAKDPWGRRLIYAVTKDLVAAPNDPNNGNISVVDEFGRNTGGINNDAHYVLLSTGQERNAVCNPNVTEDDANCDGDSTFVSGIRVRAPGANYYDDYITFRTERQIRIWLPRTAALEGTANQTERIVLNGLAIPGNVGIGTTTPTEKVDVNGTVRTEAPVGAGLYCERNGTNCLNLSTIYNLTCPSPQLMKGTRRNGADPTKLEPICETFKIYNVNPKPKCSKRMYGIRSDGSPLCGG